MTSLCVAPAVCEDVGGFVFDYTIETEDPDANQYYLRASDFSNVALQSTCTDTEPLGEDLPPVPEDTTDKPWTLRNTTPSYMNDTSGKERALSMGRAVVAAGELMWQVRSDGLDHLVTT